MTDTDAAPPPDGAEPEGPGPDPATPGAEAAAARRDGWPDPEAIDPDTGAAIVNGDFLGTGALVVACVAGVAAPDTFSALAVAVSVVLFAVGTAGLLWGYVAGVTRSRTEAVHLGGLFFLSGTAPKVIRFRMRVALAVQVVAAFAAAGARPYTSIAFASLAPMFGLGLLAAWGARHGVFPPKPPR